MYLLLGFKVDKKSINWLMKYAVPVTPLAWVHNAEVEGTIAVKIGAKGLRDLAPEIEGHAIKFMELVEGKIHTNSTRGISKQLIINKLRVIESSCQNLNLISYAKDLLIILGDSDGEASDPEVIEKESALGVDLKDVENYMLRLAKKPSIH